MTTRSRSYLKYSLSALLAVVFLYLAFRGTDFTKLYASLKGANYWWMGVMLCTLLVSHLFRSVRWRYLLNPVKSNIGIRNLFSGVMVGYLMNNILPRAGEIVRPYAIGKLESISKSAAFGTIVVERVLDTVSFLVVVLLLPVVYDGPLRETFPWLEDTGAIISSVVAGMMAIMIILMVRRDWTDAILGFLGNYMPSRLEKHVERMAHSFLDGLAVLRRPENFLMIAVLSMIIWGLYIVMMYFAFFAFGLEQQLGFRAAIVVQAISSIGVAIPTPGATGSYHVFTKQTLTGLFQVSDEVALSYATVTHAVGFIGVTIVGLYFLFRDHIKVSDAVSELPNKRE